MPGRAAVSALTGWLGDHESWLAWLVLLSAITLAASALLIPWIVVRIPPDYFRRGQPKPMWADRHPAIRIPLIVLKNLLGVALLVLGVLMLVLPGQGILTMIAGLALMDFPGRHRIVCWMVSRGPVLKSMNWIRRRAGREELVFG